MASNPSLEKQILAGQQGAWEVYADWLQAQGDPRGELAALVLKKPERVNAFVKPRRPVLFGELAMLLEDDTIEVRDWHPGFVKTLAVKPSRQNDDDLGVLLGELLAAPICTFVDGLIVTESASRWAAGLERLVNAPQAKHLRRLEVSSTDYDGGDLSAVLPKLPKLEALAIEGTEIAVAEKKLELPQLRSLRWSVGQLTNEASVLSKAKLPRLERFELSVGGGDFDDQEDEGEQAPIKCLVRMLGQGTLRALTLWGLTFDEAKLEQLLEADGLTRLHLLDLSGSFLEPEAVSMLEENVPLLQRIAKVKPPLVGSRYDAEELELDLGYDDSADEADSE